MSIQNEKATVQTILETCFGYRRGEHLLIVCDDKLRPLARKIYQIAQQTGTECLLLEMPARQMHGQEPPEEVAAALQTADLALLLTSMSLSHTQARKRASTVFGTRIASLPGITPEIFNRSIKLNYPALGKKVANVVGVLNQGQKLAVYTDKGTRLVMKIKGRSGFADDGLYTRPGAFGNLPAGEACIAPCEGSTNGVLVVDGSAPFVGRLKRPVKIVIKNGLIQHLPLAKIRAMIKPLGKCARNIAEFGIGLNPKAKVTGNILEDEKTKQTAHLAIGANISFGGKVACACHLDFVFLKPVIFVDGKRLEI